MENNKDNINDETRIIRFLDLDGAEKSIGEYSSVGKHGELSFTFHFGFVDDYKKQKNQTGDKYEGTVQVNCNGHLTYDGTCNDALISCWSLWHEGDIPWDSFPESAFVNSPNTVCAIVSTIGKIRNLFEDIININKKVFRNYRDIVIAEEHGPIYYYPDQIGISNEAWDKKTLDGCDILKKTKETYFQKRNKNEHSQNYAAECEYRFAMILSPDRTSPDSDSDLYIKNLDLLIRDYPLTRRECKHYIDKVFLDLDSILTLKTKEEKESKNEKEKKERQLKICHSINQINATCFFTEVPITTRKGKKFNHVEFHNSLTSNVHHVIPV